MNYSTKSRLRTSSRAASSRVARTKATAFDKEIMAHCIALSEKAARKGEHPFAAVICTKFKIIAAATNRAVRDRDVSRHAEIVALSEAQRVLRGKAMEDCTLYTNVEPCTMCSFPIREARVGKVVFAITSPLMGGLSRWNILADDKLSSKLPDYFGPVPEILPGLLAKEAERVWHSWNRKRWKSMKSSGCFEIVPYCDACADQ